MSMKVTQVPGAPPDLAVDPWGRIGVIIKWGFLLRLLALAAATWGLVGTPLTAQILLAILALGATSFIGLSRPDAVEFVVRHPLISMLDLAVVLAVFAVLGVQSPLVLATLSTALLIGVLHRLATGALLAGTLLVGYMGAAVRAAGNGEPIGFLLSVGLPVTFVGLVGIGSVIRQMETTQRKAERDLAQAAWAGAVVAERLRLAREMHDSLAKTLQGLAFTAASLPKWLEKDPSRAMIEARSMVVGANQAAGEARALLSRMRADDPGRPFEEIVRETAQNWQAQTGQPVEVVAEPVPGIGPGVRYELLVALSEVLENVKRHAPEATVKVRLRVNDATVILKIMDDGPGFAIERLQAAETEGHFGLRGLSERMREVKGSAWVESAPGAGTTAVLTAPWDAKEVAR